MLTASRKILLCSMWVSFGSFVMFSIFYRWDLHNLCMKLAIETCVAIANLWWSIKKNNQMKNRTSSDIGIRGKVIGTAILLIFSWIYRSYQLCSLLWSSLVSKIWRCSPISFKHASLWCWFYAPHLTTHQPNARCPIKKVIEWHPQTLHWHLLH